MQFGDDTTLTAALLNGEIDVLYNLPSAEVENCRSDGWCIRLQIRAADGYLYWIKPADRSLSDLRVRQALAYGIDKQAIINTVYGDGNAYVCDDVFPSNHWSHSDNVTVYDYDPAKSKELLEEAGYTMNDATGYYEK